MRQLTVRRFLPFLLFVLVANAATGPASYYAGWYEGRLTASGQPYRRNGYTAASYAYYLRTVEVTNLANGRKVVVFVNDKGPNVRLNRLIDLSERSFAEIASSEDIARGTAKVSIRVIGKGAR